MRLFIADDSETLRSQLVEILSEFKEIKIVGQTKFAHEAVRNIRKLNPDVVILDIRMPDGNGIGVLKEIRKSDNLTRIIIFTNYPYAQYKKKCLELGANFFFHKATEFEELIEVLRQLIPCFK